MKSNWRYVIEGLLFAGLVVIVIALQPRRTSNFKYYFEVGKPWRYELLTAPEDFPIYKTESQLQQEREQVLKSFTPYYTIHSEIGYENLNKLLKEEAANDLSDKQREYLKNQFTHIYGKGVIAAGELESLRKNYKKITILNSRHEAVVQETSNLFTPKSAYDRVMDNAPLFSGSRFRDLNINLFLTPNLTYDTLTSTQMRESMLASVSLTEGVVQTGERIIDKGEIVTERTGQVLNSLRVLYNEREEDRHQTIWSRTGYILLVCLFIGLLALYLFIFRKDYCKSIKNIVFICSLIALLSIISSLLLRFSSLSIYLIPFAWVPMLIRIFFDSRTAFQVHLATIMLAALAVNAPFEFMVVQLAVGIVAVSGMKDLADRSQLALTTIWIFLTYVAVYTAFTIATTGDLHMLDGWQYACFTANALLILLIYGLIYLCEKLFGFVSSFTLVELTNVNNSLLLRFAEVAPGTFQHSLQVSNLATEAAKKIKVNALLVRAGALYHDIGKMSAPQNFTENQTDGVNPLLQMSETEAAQVIIAHTTEGVRLAHHYNLPKVMIQFIASHHGTSKVRYFYNNWCNRHPGEEPDEALFTYPGSKPQTAETGILMMADAVEARSRSLTTYTEESISEMVEQMIGAQIADGQLSETPLSFKDVEDIKAVFKEKLIQMNHHRIAYPERKK